jgi:hypothetical protein
MARARLRSILCAVLVMQSITVPALAQDAKTHLAAADKAVAQKNWPAAAAEYEAANKAEPSAIASEGHANASYMMKNDADAYAAYDRFLKEWGAKVAPYKKTLAETRMKEIAGRTGEITLTISEQGATVTVDDKPGATTMRLAPGPHRVRVTKDGFLAFDQAPNVVAGQSQTIDVKLQAQTNKGRLSVHEKTGQPIRVIVDNVDQGDAPWTGDVDPGTHQVSGRGGAVIAPAQSVSVERGKTADVELVASSSTAPLKIVTSDGKGMIYVDDKFVGEGQFSGDLVAGQHHIRVTRDGYDTFDETVTLTAKEPLVRSVTLKLASTISTSKVEVQSRGLEGIYGGFGLMGLIAPAGYGSSPETLCDGPHPTELTSCDKGTNLGAGLNGFIGYHWDPVGVELFVGAHYDTQSPKLVWAASSVDKGIGGDPARTEDFALHRAGGFGALRIRLTLQGEKLRFSAAAGVGLGYMVTFLKRVTTAASDPNLQDGFAPDSQGYLTPVLSFDPSIQYRLTPTIAVALGMTLLLESARAFDQIPHNNPESNHSLGPNGLTTPRYDFATGTELYIGPFIGMMFGP